MGRSAARLPPRGMTAPGWPSATARSGSGRQCARCSRPLASNAAGGISRPMFCRAAEISTSGGIGRPQGDSTPRTSTRPKSRSRPSRSTTAPSTPKRSQDRRRPRRAARVLQVPGRTLDPLEDHEPDRKHFRHSAIENESHQGTRIASRRNCHGLQADRRRTSPLASSQRTPPGRPRPCRRRLPQSKLLERPVDITPAEPSESTETEVA